MDYECHVEWSPQSRSAIIVDSPCKVEHRSRDLHWSKVAHVDAAATENQLAVLDGVAAERRGVVGVLSEFFRLYGLFGLFPKMFSRINLPLKGLILFQTSLN